MACIKMNSELTLACLMLGDFSQIPQSLQVLRLSSILRMNLKVKCKLKISILKILKIQSRIFKQLSLSSSVGLVAASSHCGSAAVSLTVM